MLRSKFQLFMILGGTIPASIPGNSGIRNNRYCLVIIKILNDLDPRKPSDSSSEFTIH